MKPVKWDQLSEVEQSHLLGINGAKFVQLKNLAAKMQTPSLTDIDLDTFNPMSSPITPNAPYTSPTEGRFSNAKDNHSSPLTTSDRGVTSKHRIVIRLLGAVLAVFIWVNGVSGVFSTTIEPPAVMAETRSQYHKDIRKQQRQLTFITGRVIDTMVSQGKIKAGIGEKINRIVKNEIIFINLEIFEYPEQEFTYTDSIQMMARVEHIYDIFASRLAKEVNRTQGIKIKSKYLALRDSVMTIVFGLLLFIPGFWYGMQGFWKAGREMLKDQEEIKSVRPLLKVAFVTNLMIIYADQISQWVVYLTGFVKYQIYASFSWLLYRLGEGGFPMIIFFLSNLDIGRFIWVIPFIFYGGLKWALLGYKGGVKLSNVTRYASLVMSFGAMLMMAGILSIFFSYLQGGYYVGFMYFTQNFAESLAGISVDIGYLILRLGVIIGLISYIWDKIVFRREAKKRQAEKFIGTALGHFESKIKEVDYLDKYRGQSDYTDPDHDNLKVKVDGVKIRFKVDFALLKYLTEHTGRVNEFEILMKQAFRAYKGISPEGYSNIISRVKNKTFKAIRVIVVDRSENIVEYDLEGNIITINKILIDMKIKDEKRIFNFSPKDMAPTLQVGIIHSLRRMVISDLSEIEKMMEDDLRLMLHLLSTKDNLFVYTDIMEKIVKDEKFYKTLRLMSEKYATENPIAEESRMARWIGKARVIIKWSLISFFVSQTLMMWFAEMLPRNVLTGVIYLWMLPSFIGIFVGLWTIGRFFAEKIFLAGERIFVAIGVDLREVFGIKIVLPRFVSQILDQKIYGHK